MRGQSLYLLRIQTAGALDLRDAHQSDTLDESELEFCVGLREALLNEDLERLGEQTFTWNAVERIRLLSAPKRPR